MIESVKWYIDTWMKAMLRPVLFYQELPEGSWSEAPLRFVIATGWIMSFAITLSVFVMMYVPTGFELISGIKGRELIIVMPVLLLMGFVFFIMTILIVAAFVVAALLALLSAVAGVLNFLLILLGGSGNLNETMKAVFYSGGIFLVGVFTVLLAVLVKWHALSFNDWMTGESTLFYTAAIYIYGLWSIAGKKTHDVPRWKAFLAAIFPFLLMVVFNIVFAAKILPKFSRFIL